MIGFGSSRAIREAVPLLTVAGIAVGTWATLEEKVPAWVTIALAVVACAGVYLTYWQTEPIRVRVKPTDWLSTGDPPSFYVEIKDRAHGFSSPNFMLGMSHNGKEVMYPDHVPPTHRVGKATRVVLISQPDIAADYYLIEIRP